MLTLPASQHAQAAYGVNVSQPAELRTPTAKWNAAGLLPSRTTLFILSISFLLVTGCDAAVLEPSTGPNASEESHDGEPSEEPTPDAFEPIRLQGRGSKVARFRIPRDSAAIAEISHRGSSNFAIWSVARNGAKNELLVNTIGNYEGTVLFDEQSDQHFVAFEVEADGRWVVRILPVTRAKQWNGRQTLDGRGDQVIRLDPSSSGLVSTRIRHDGSSNFAVMAYGDTTELLVNEIGRYRGESLLPNGTIVLEISADGRWSFSSLR